MATDNRKLYITDVGDEMFSSGLAPGSTFDSLITGATNIDQPYGVAVDTASGKMYYVSQTDGLIQKANLDGTNIVTIADTGDGFTRPIGITLDRLRQKLYVTDFTNDDIHILNTDGTDVSVFLDSGDGLDEPLGIFVDALGGKIYWHNQGSTNNMQRCDLDGTNISTFIATIVDGQEIGIHRGSGFIFWTQFGSPDRVARADLEDGGNITGIVTTGFNDLRGLVVDQVNPKVYFADDTPDQIGRVDFDGSNQVIVLNTIGSLRGLDLDQIDIPKKIDLFLQGVDVSSGDINLFIDGVGKSSGVIDLFLEGPAGGSIDLFIKVAELASGTMELLLRGPNAAGSGDLFIQGHIPSSGDIDLFEHGHAIGSGDINLFISGPTLVSGDIGLVIINSGVINQWPCFIQTIDNNPSGDIPLRIHGTTTPGLSQLLNETRLFIQNSGSDVIDPPVFDNTFSMYMEVPSGIPDASGFWPVFMRVEGDLTSSFSLFIRSGPNVSGEVSLFIKQDPGFNVTPGFTPSRNEWAVFAQVIQGVPGSVELSISGSPIPSTGFDGSGDLFIKPHDVSSGDVSLHMLGISGISSGDITLFIVAETGVINSRPILYTHGF